MQPKITLILAGERGGTRELPVLSSRFTIGRGSENDLVIDDAALSRRHAVIEIGDGLVQVSDCGSVNGTFVNSTRLTAPKVVTDQDVISITDVYQISVRIGNGQDRGSRYSDNQNEKLPPRPSDKSYRISGPIIALGAIATILLVAGTLLVLLGNKGSLSGDGVSDQGGQANENQPGPLSGGSAGTESGERRDAGTCGTASPERIENEAVQVLLRTTIDRQRYEFPPGVLTQIQESIERYCKVAELQVALRSIARHRSEIAADVRRRGQGLEPYFVAYAVLAQTDGGRTGSDYVATARQMLPTLVTVGIDFGNDADSSLIVLAAQTMGPGTKKSHPLLPKIRELIGSNPAAKRSVWYLYEHNGISREAYSFVIRFLALGIIAQNPRQFGIDVEPLTF